MKNNNKISTPEPTTQAGRSLFKTLRLQMHMDWSDNYDQMLLNRFKRANKFTPYARRIDKDYLEAILEHERAIAMIEL